MYSGGSGLSIDIHFVDIELSYDVLSPLPIVLSKHFNHPHPYIEIATAISDTPMMFIDPCFNFETNKYGYTLAEGLITRFPILVIHFLCTRMRRYNFRYTDN